MKKVLIVLFSILCLASFAFAANAKVDSSDQPAKLAVSFDPLGLLIFSFPFSVEYAITPDISAVADVFYSPNIVWITDISVLDINAGARYYFGDKLHASVPDWLKGPALRGLFGGFRLAYANETWNYGSSGYNYTGALSQFGIGVEAGLKYYLKGKRGWFAEGALGFMYYLPATWTWTLNGTTYTWPVEPSSTYNPTGLTYGGKIGFAF